MGRGTRNKPRDRQQRGRFARGRGYAVLGTGVAAVAGGVFAALPHHPSTAQPVASDCGPQFCSTVAPSPVVASLSAGSSPGPRSRRKPHARHTAKPRTHRAKTPQVLASPAATQPAGPPPTVAVTYSLVQKWNGGFQGEFTITNNGGSWLNGWQLVATLPGDQVTSASGSAYQTSGGTVTFDQALLQGGIGPGSSLTLHFDANGSTTSPSGCSFNGSACAA